MKHIYTQMLLGRARNPLAYTNKIKALGPIAYYPQAEPSGTTIGDESGNGRNGTYVGVTLGQPGIGDGRTAASYDGATSYGNIYSASLAAAFNGAEGSIITWERVANAGVWTESGADRCSLAIGNGGSNTVRAMRGGANNQYLLQYSAGGTTRLIFATLSTTSWFQIALTWSKTADQFKAYLNGTQVGATQTGLGTWAGTLSNGETVIGAINTSPFLAWFGSLAHTAIFNRALSAAEIASLAVVP